MNRLPSDAVVIDVGAIERERDESRQESIDRARAERDHAEARLDSYRAQVDGQLDELAYTVLREAKQPLALLDLKDNDARLVLEAHAERLVDVLAGHYEKRIAALEAQIAKWRKAKRR